LKGEEKKREKERNHFKAYTTHNIAKTFKTFKIFKFNIWVLIIWYNGGNAQREWRNVTDKTSIRSNKILHSFALDIWSNIFWWFLFICILWVSSQVEISINTGLQNNTEKHHTVAYYKCTVQFQITLKCYKFIC